MTTYVDIPHVDALYKENEQIGNAITMLDSGGAITNMTVAPPAAPPEGPPAGPGLMMATTIVIPGPNDPALIAAARAELVARSAAITAELASLGITAAPPART